MFLLKDKNRLLQKTPKELIRRYGEQKNVAGSSVGKPVRSVVTSFVGMIKCISRAIPKCCLRDISKLEYFSKRMRWSWT